MNQKQKDWNTTSSNLMGWNFDKVSNLGHLAIDVNKILINIWQFINQFKDGTHELMPASLKYRGKICCQKYTSKVSRCLSNTFQSDMNKKINLSQTKHTEWRSNRYHSQSKPQKSTMADRSLVLCDVLCMLF